MMAMGSKPNKVGRAALQLRVDFGSELFGLPKIGADTWLSTLASSSENRTDTKRHGGLFRHFKLSAAKRSKRELLGGA